MLLNEGFILSAFNEWGPSIEQLDLGLNWIEVRERPAFLLVNQGI